MDKVNLAETFARFDEQWKPKRVATVDDFDVKLVKVEGDFVWHKHDAEDELFLVVSGRLGIDFRDRTVELEEGELIVVPRGVEHKPFAERECQVLLLERRGVVNTGDAAPSARTAALEDL